MKATDLINICPYTGLRSFTEEESLYFKGRDLQVDQITSLLEQNKFLMVTGASGEGKSSLIYGGLIPNARAGFFKARYSNWLVVDFRPERSPVTNMAHAIAAQLNSNAQTVETELRRGFSSLVDLYTHSEYYGGEEGAGSAEAQLLREKKRKSANLLIIVDQFEEFFTNPENYYNEVLSRDSQIVVNLILETARISIQRNLPIYVVCTMRSDYIGQCSAFRGLPEYIGFSQFFVPRLKRKDLKQVIEEPALLSGNRISQRLIERLVFDISEGVDQLPILQHALSRIWIAASHGSEEMDLIHYAMAGGMPADDLPDEDMERFGKWFARLPEHQQQFYTQTGLAKIIEIHANLLYENAWDSYYRLHPDTALTQAEAKRIVALTFSCLTKIDNSRAVRNRMTLGEITAIIHNPKLTTEVVGEVLNPFREEGNSFIRPFKTSDPASHHLEADTVLDITHESLIRNWNKLNQWATREFEFYSTFLDFQKQLNRWKESGKSSGYLLPIGPLTYFENWYRNCKPNTGWIRRYMEGREDPLAMEQAAGQTLSDTKEFLGRSARKVVATRAFMKYGPQRIATVFAIVVMLVLSGFYWYNADQKRNERVIERIRKESFSRLQSKDVDLKDKALYLLTEERFQEGSLIPYLRSLYSSDRVSLANETYKQLLLINKHQEGLVKNRLFELITQDLGSPDVAADPQYMLKELNKFLILLMMDHYYEPSERKQTVLTTLTRKNFEVISGFYSNRGLFHPVVPTELNMAVHLWLTTGKATQEQARALIGLLSPFAGGQAAKTFDLYYSKGSFEPNGRQSMDFNMGYHTLASLYAVAGDLDHVLQCFDKLLENNQRDYFEAPRILNNHLGILGYLYQYGHRDKVPAFLQWLAVHTKDNPPVTLLRNVVIRSGYISHLYYINIERGYYRSTRGYLYPNLCLVDRAAFDAMTEDYEKAIGALADPQQRHFTMAMELKRKAIFYSKYWYDRHISVDQPRLDGWFKQAVESYLQTDSAYLEGKESTTLVYNGDGVRTSDTKRRDLFLYPDYRDGWFAWTYHHDFFFNYLLNNHLLEALYKTGADLQSLHLWVTKAYEYKTEISPQSYSNPYPFADATLLKILDFADHHPQGAAFDRNLPYLLLAAHTFDKGDTAAAMGYFHHLDMATIYHSADKYEYLEKVFYLNAMKDLCIRLADAGKYKDAVALAEQLTLDRQRIFAYIFMAQRVYRQGANPQVFVFLDSAYAKARKVDYSNLEADLDSRFGQIMVLSEIGSRALNNNAAELLRDIPEVSKFYGVQTRVMGIADEGNYFAALTSIPSTLTESQELECRTMILLENCRQKERAAGNTDWTSMDSYTDWQWYFINFIPN